MNKLLKKLHKNKVIMSVYPEDPFFRNKIHVRFTRGVMNRQIELDLGVLLSCNDNAEFILLQEFKQFLSELNLEDEDDETEN